MVSASKQLGAGLSMWPAGSSVDTISDEFLRVLSHTLTILSWFENVPSEDIPPAWMWALDWELEKHWKLVKSKRDKGLSSQSPTQTYEEESENLLFDDWAAELRKP